MGKQNGSIEGKETELSHTKFLECRNLITETLNGKNLKSVLGYINHILDYFGGNKLDPVGSEKFRLISLENENILSDGKYRLTFLLQLSIFFFGLDHQLKVHKGTYPRLSSDDSKTVLALKKKTETLLNQMKMSDSKRNVGEVFEKFTLNEESMIDWKNNNCPSLSFNIKETDEDMVDNLLKKRELIRRKNGNKLFFKDKEMAWFWRD